MSALAQFSPEIRRWFEQTFDGPTPAQERGWPAIASGRHTLIQAPTGSGKTLAAFLWALDRAEPGAGVQVLYVSPLKALNYDVERNLRGPLAGIGSELSVAVHYAAFEDWWEPYTLGVGPAGAYLAGLEPDERDSVRERCREAFPAGDVTVHAVAWTARCRA